jgi:hypothetical protein
MRRLFGVVMLAAVPMACGTVPSAPTASLPDGAAAGGAFTASARIAPTCSEKADWASVRGAVVGVSARGRGSVTVRSDLVLFGGSGLPPCYTAVFSVKPSGRGILLQPGSNPREAMLRAPDGIYEIAVRVEGSAKPAYTASVMVELPGK